MAATKFGIDGGIASGVLTPVVASIGLATETDSALPVVAFDVSQITLFGIDGAIGFGNAQKDFIGKTRGIGLATETNTALSVIDPSAVGFAIGLTTEANIALSVSAGAAPSISLVSSIRGTNIITADNTLTVQVDSTTNATSITVNGVATSGFTVVTSTELTCIVPRGIGAPYSGNVDVVVDSTLGLSAPFSALWEPPFGMVETDFTVNYAGLDPDSPFAGDPTPDSLGVSMDGAGEFTITGTITQIQTFDYYIYDASDDTVSPTIEQITLHPGPVEVPIGQASETDTAHSVTDNLGTIGLIGIATETDSALPVEDGSGIVTIIGLASESDSALAVTAKGPSQTIAIGLATESDSAIVVEDGSTITATIGLATEVDTTFPVIDFQAVSALIGIATETDSAIEVSFPATLDSIRDQIEELQAIILAQQLQIDDLYTRFDLNTSAPQTYTIDGVTISSDNFILTKTDNLDGTFTINRS
jgi:hypothetical protein